MLSAINDFGNYNENGYYHYCKAEIAEIGDALKHAMYMTVPGVESRMLFHVFTQDLMNMSPVNSGKFDAEEQLNFIEKLSTLLGYRSPTHHGSSKAEEYWSIFGFRYSLPIFVEMGTTDDFTLYHLFGFDASTAAYIRKFAKANFKLYRIQKTTCPGMFGREGKILRVDLADLTFRTLLGDTLNRGDVIGERKL